MLHVYVDADGCPVKDEIYKVAERYRLCVTMVANSWMRIPYEDRYRLQVVGQGFDAADDWIVEHVDDDDVVITADIPLAARCLERGARVLGPKGSEFTQDTIGEAQATRELLSTLREAGTITGGPAPFQKQDRSRFLHRLDEIVQAVRRRHGAR